MNKALVSTMDVMSKESHPFYINSQLAGSSTQSLENMYFDIDNETISYSQPFDSSLSPEKPPMMDTVDWASSQPVALKSLLSEVTKIPAPLEKRPITYEPTWSTSDGFFNQVASTSRSHLERRSRPLRRTNSNARARLGPEAVSTSNPPPAPDGAFWGKDRMAILAACQNVSERMDESAFALAAQAYNTAPLKPPSKRQPKVPRLTDISKTRRASTSHPITYGREGVNRWEKGKQRASLLPEATPSGTSYQRSTSMPVVRSLQRVASSSSSASRSTDCSLSESPDTSMMDIDTDLLDETPPTSVPVSPPIPPIKRPPQPAVPTSSTSISASTSIPASTPASQIKLHPLLTQPKQPTKNPHTTKPPPHVARQNSKPPPPPLPPSQAPLLSQSTRPPILGMRRAHTTPVAATHVLPTRQKAFKPPLLSQPARPQAKTNTALAPVSLTETNLKSRPPELNPLLEPDLEPETNPDADSSFGDISLGLDDEELELTMRQYD